MISGAANRDHVLYSFVQPVDLRTIADEEPELLELILTPAFGRLKHIHFLGGIDYLLVRAPNGAKGNIRHTRYQHSLGVARLALRYSSHRELPSEDRRVITTAALLHDIGHAPFSHSLEPIFKEVFGLEHHQATRDIVTGRVPLGREVYETLRRNKVDVEKVVAIIAGEELGYDNFFSGPINFDTIEGILRSLTYGRPKMQLPSPEAVMEAALRRLNHVDCRLVDEFWTYKDHVYRYIINSLRGVLADTVCQSFMRRHLEHIVDTDYFLTEKEMFRKLPGLRARLRSRSFISDINCEIDGPILFKERRFFIDSTGDFYQRQDYIRYKQSKAERMLLPTATNALEPMSELNQDLFDDDRHRPSASSIEH
jgi:hypothetical protein